jgi:hypothetical protein
MQSVLAFRGRFSSLAGVVHSTPRASLRVQHNLEHHPRILSQRPGLLRKAASTMSSLVNGIAVPPSAHETYGNFDLVKRVKLDFTDVTVSKWRSRVSGLTIVHLDYEGYNIPTGNSVDR